MGKLLCFHRVQGIDCEASYHKQEEQECDQTKVDAEEQVYGSEIVHSRMGLVSCCSDMVWNFISDVFDVARDCVEQACDVNEIKLHNRKKDAHQQTDVTRHIDIKYWQMKNDLQSVHIMQHADYHHWKPNDANHHRNCKQSF